MKDTKIMVAVIVTFILSWLAFGFLNYLLTDNTFKQAVTDMPVVLGTIILGWIPCVFVGCDLNKLLK